MVIPNCVNYPGSTVILDIKLENWFSSAGFRQKQLGQECSLSCARRIRGEPPTAGH
ncbi:type IV secretory system conjugative DNA transfer family protein (plasmid) [Escherichia coli]|uniref:type IV secretory system conjugative DNA transfer family protein n=1 Tax=Escherichia coli TaxID=562 RepID=UPI003AAB42C0